MAGASDAPTMITARPAEPHSPPVSDVQMDRRTTPRGWRAAGEVGPDATRRRHDPEPHPQWRGMWRPCTHANTLLKQRTRLGLPLIPVGPPSSTWCPITHTRAPSAEPIGRFATNPGSPTGEFTWWRSVAAVGRRHFEVRSRATACHVLRRIPQMWRWRPM